MEGLCFLTLRGDALLFTVCGCISLVTSPVAAAVEMQERRKEVEKLTSWE